jgi:hypothetical protein
MFKGNQEEITAANSSFAIGWLTEEQSATNR